MNVFADRALARRCLFVAAGSQLLVAILYLTPGVDLSFHGGGPVPVLVYAWLACLPGLVAVDVLGRQLLDWGTYLALFISDVVVWFVVAYALARLARLIALGHRGRTRSEGEPE